jgi:hypothetical protein
MTATTMTRRGALGALAGAAASALLARTAPAAPATPPASADEPAPLARLVATLGASPRWPANARTARAVLSHLLPAEGLGAQETADALAAFDRALAARVVAPPTEALPAGWRWRLLEAAVSVDHRTHVPNWRGIDAVLDYLRALDPVLGDAFGEAFGAALDGSLRFGAVAGYALGKTEAGDPDLWPFRAAELAGLAPADGSVEQEGYLAAKAEPASVPKWAEECRWAPLCDDLPLPALTPWGQEWLERARRSRSWPADADRTGYEAGTDGRGKIDPLEVVTARLTILAAAGREARAAEVAGAV